MIKVKINGQERNWDGDPDLPLLWFLRDEVGLTGTKFGCGQALCGACTIMIDKQAVRACITSVSDADGREVMLLAKADISNLKLSLSTFETDNGRFPTAEEGLNALVTKPGADLPNWNHQYIEKVPNDPWGHPYQYRVPGTNGKDFDLLSFGPDGAEGGNDDIEP